MLIYSSRFDEIMVKQLTKMWKYCSSNNNPFPFTRGNGIPVDVSAMLLSQKGCIHVLIFCFYDAQYLLEGVERGFYSQ